MTAVYKCPMCGEETPRDAAIFMDHTNQHIVDQIKKHHPEWSEADGACKKCVEYYRRQLSGQG